MLAVQVKAAFKSPQTREKSKQNWRRARQLMDGLNAIQVGTLLDSFQAPSFDCFADLLAQCH
jgi:hypothetical protein